MWEDQVRIDMESRHKILREMTDFRVWEDIQGDNFSLTLNPQEKMQLKKKLHITYNNDEQAQNGSL
jgi:hypothetical protein